MISAFTVPTTCGDESSATWLTAIAHWSRRVPDDLRELAQRTRPDVSAAKRMLKTFNGIGDTRRRHFHARSKTSDLGTTVFRRSSYLPRAKQLACPPDPALASAPSPMRSLLR